MPNVHKDFHGALSYGLQFVVEHYGKDGLEDFLTRLADTVYAPLVVDLRKRGLPALRDHWAGIFDAEGGDYSMEIEGDTLVLNLQRCPAIHHMQDRDYAVAEHFCEHTRIVNEAICRAAGYISSVDYDQAQGRCVQKFWRAEA
jgi:hypothetical protein